MPFKDLAGRLIEPTRRNRDGLSRFRTPVELPAVAKLPAQPRAHDQALVRCDSEVSRVEERVHIGPEREPIVDSVLSALGERSDMRGLQHWPDLVARDGAPMRVDAANNALEGALPESTTEGAKSGGGAAGSSKKETSRMKTQPIFGSSCGASGAAAKDRREKK